MPPTTKDVNGNEVDAANCKNRWMYEVGTSMSAPLTAGVAVTYQAHTPQVDPAALRYLVSVTGATANAVTTALSGES